MNGDNLLRFTVEKLPALENFLSDSAEVDWIDENIFANFESWGNFKAICFQTSKESCFHMRAQRWKTVTLLIEYMC